MSALGELSAPGGGGCLLQGGVCSGGGCLLWRVSAVGGSAPVAVVCSGGVSSLGGCGIPACTEADTPRCEQNDRQV